MSPELLEGATEFSSFAFQQIDVYAAALVVWEILFRTQIPDTVEGNISLNRYSTFLRIAYVILNLDAGLGPIRARSAGGMFRPVWISPGPKIPH